MTACRFLLGCSGEIYLKYRDSISSRIVLADPGGQLQTAMGELTDHINLNYPNYAVTIDNPGGTSICASTASATYIMVRSDIGNVEPIELLAYTRVR